MKQYRINFGNIANVKRFSEKASVFDGDIQLESDTTIINGKSVLGIFSLDLTKVLTIEIGGDSKSVERFYLDAVKPLVVR